MHGTGNEDSQARKGKLAAVGIFRAGLVLEPLPAAHWCCCWLPLRRILGDNCGSSLASGAACARALAVSDRACQEDELEIPVQNSTAAGDRDPLAAGAVK